MKFLLVGVGVVGVGLVGGLGAGLMRVVGVWGVEHGWGGGGKLVRVVELVGLGEVGEEMVVGWLVSWLLVFSGAGVGLLFELGDFRAQAFDLCEELGLIGVRCLGDCWFVVIGFDTMFVQCFDHVGGSLFVEFVHQLLLFFVSCLFVDFV